MRFAAASRPRWPGCLAGTPNRRLPARFPLTAAQLVLAREHGFASWARMRRYVKIVTDRAWTPGKPAPADESLADRFLRLACLTYSDDEPADAGRGRSASRRASRTSPTDLFVAAACADPTAVRRHLRRPSAATETGGPHGWSPLLYQAYARHDPHVERAATLETAQLLLDAGADPNDGRFWHALPTPFTVLTGVLGHGEHRQPWHRHAIAFARLLLQRGAIRTMGRPSTTACSAPTTITWSCSSSTASVARPPARGIGCSARPSSRRLRCCGSCWPGRSPHDQRQRVTLLAEHGVDIVSPFSEGRAPRRRTPLEVALTNGHRELADLLTALGARPPRLSVADAFVAAVMAGDADAVRRTAPDVIEAVRRKRTGLVTWAAAQGAPTAVELLVSAGFDVNALGRSDVAGNQPWHTALHVAAEKGDLVLVRTLLDLGADPNIPDKHYQSTPLGLGPLLRPTRGRRPARTGNPWRIPHWQK